MNKEQAVKYLSFSGFSDEQIKAIEGAFTCEDAISREAAIRAIEALQRPIMREESNYYQFKFSGMSEALGAVENLPSVTPQQRTGRWERMSDLPNDVDDRFECSRCGNIVHHRSVMDLRTFSRWCGRCGSYNDYKKEVEE